MQSYRQLITEAERLEACALSEPNFVIAAVYLREEHDTRLMAALQLICDEAAKDTP